MLPFTIVTVWPNEQALSLFDRIYTQFAQGKYQGI